MIFTFISCSSQKNEVKDSPPLAGVECNQSYYLEKIWCEKTNKYVIIEIGDSEQEVIALLPYPDEKEVREKYYEYFYYERGGYGTMEYFKITFRNQIVIDKTIGKISLDPW